MCIIYNNIEKVWCWEMSILLLRLLLILFLLILLLFQDFPIISLILALHISIISESPTLRFMSNTINSFPIYVFHLRAGLSFRLLSGGSHSSIVFGNLCSGIRWTWPYHCGALFSNVFVAEHSTSVRFHIFPVLILSFLVICRHVLIKSNSRVSI